MNLLTSLLRIFQRYPPRRWLLLTIPLISIIAMITLSTQDYDTYTNTSVQAMQDKIKQLTDTIDDWRKQGLSTLADSLNNYDLVGFGGYDKDEEMIPTVDPESPPKGVILMFARTMDLFSTLDTVRTVEDRFNRRYKYDWMIVSDGAHSINFQSTLSSLIHGDVKFVTVDRKLHFNSKDLNNKKLKDVRVKMKKGNVKEKFSIRTKLLQQFWTTSIFQLDELNEYDYFMKVSPGLQFDCDISIDLIKFMAANSKNYGFALANKNSPNIYEGLWPSALNYISKKPRDIHPNNLIDFVSDDDGLTLNNCQFETFFEIGYLKFFRSKRYINFMDHFLESRNIFYENWKDSTLRTLAISLLDDSSYVQFFNNLGISNSKKEKFAQYSSCPFDTSFRLTHTCICDPIEDFTWQEDSCVEKFYKANNVVLPRYVELERETIRDTRAREAERKEAEKQRRIDEELLRQQLEKANEELNPGSSN